jgi:hypothetical protein
VAGLCLLFACLLRPLLIVALAASSAAAFFAFGSRGRALIVMGRQLSRAEAVGAFMGASLLLLLLTGGHVAVTALALALVLSLAHAALRERSVKARGLAFFDLRGGVTPLGSALKAMHEEDSDADGDADGADGASAARGRALGGGGGGGGLSHRGGAGARADEENPEDEAAAAAAAAPPASREAFRAQMKAKYTKPL